jgi:hypothetical protein
LENFTFGHREIPEIETTNKNGVIVIVKGDLMENLEVRRKDVSFFVVQVSIVTVEGLSCSPVGRSDDAQIPFRNPPCSTEGCGGIKMTRDSSTKKIKFNGPRQNGSQGEERNE